MALVTRCPACGTAFKVVPDQLRISDGWVRCGRCSKVFDATVDLQEAAAGDIAKSGTSVPDGARESATAPDLPVVSNMSVAQEVVAGNDAPTTPELATAANIAAGSQAMQANDLAPSANELVAGAKISEAPANGIDAASAEVRGAPDDLGDAPTALREAADGLPAEKMEQSLRPSAIATTGAPHLIAASSQAPSTDDEADAQLHKALRRARAKAAKRARAERKLAGPTGAQAAPAVDLRSTNVKDEPAQSDTIHAAVRKHGWRAVSFFKNMASWRGHSPSVSIGVLTALLLLQVVYHDRDSIAGRAPGLKPMLVRLCDMFGCAVGAPRDIASIAIDGATFERDRNDTGYRLAFTLHNAAEVPLATPAVELTLMDTQERAVVRRVIRPDQFGAPALLDGGAERSAALAVRVGPATAGTLPPVAGYRLVAFYP